MQLDASSMARRALLTESEREAIRDPDSRDNPYVAVSRVRKKIQEELSTDVEVLREHHPDLLSELREIVCEDTDTIDIAESGSPVETVETEETPEFEPPREPEPTPSPREDTEETLRDLGLPGSGNVLDARIEAIADLYEHLREREGEVVETQELKDLVDADDVSYSSVDSFWTNAVKKVGDRPNALTTLPGVEELGNGRYQYSGETDE